MTVIVAFTIGLLAGIAFFGGLWVTVNKTLGKAYAALYFVGSSIIRTAIVVTGFYYVAQNGLSILLMSVAGFLIGRFLVFWITYYYEKKQKLSSSSNQQ
ncbi:MAG: ATP synthase subunit I [Pelobium sp.]